MKHLGDISKINGADIEPVDLITFGSPCQDLSVAGKRAGMKHEANGDGETTRSGLFMEAVRIIKEMREATNGKHPRFALWENVPGAFSSNKGEDFRIVLEELIKIVEKDAVMPKVPKNGWAYADSYSGQGWSLSYRTFDAQYWGVPQRRRRIYLVADFGGQCAKEILFEREGLRGNFAQGKSTWQGAATDVEGGAGTADREGESTGRIRYQEKVVGIDLYNQATTGKVAKPLTAAACDSDHVPCVAYTGRQLSGRECYGFPLGFRPENVRCYQEKATTLCNGTRAGFCNGVVVSGGFKAGQGVNARGIGWEEEQTPTLASENGGNSVPSVCYMERGVFRKGTRPHNVEEAQTWEEAKIANTLNTFDHGESRTNELVVEQSEVFSLQGNTVDRDAKQNGNGISKGVSHTLNSVDKHGVVYGIGNGQCNQSFMTEQAGALNCMHDQQAIVFDKEVYNSGINGTGGHYISEGGPAPTLRGTGHAPGVCTQYIVRRLTPTECARLQGFPDEWGHIDHKDRLTPEELSFWQEVRNSHASINSKLVKEYTEKQMLSWYNKLHTDSAEYRMWGNGLALPTALYCMEGIAEVFDERQ